MQKYGHNFTYVLSECTAPTWPIRRKIYTVTLSLRVNNFIRKTHELC